MRDSGSLSPQTIVFIILLPSRLRDLCRWGCWKFLTVRYHGGLQGNIIFPCNGLTHIKQDYTYKYIRTVKPITRQHLIEKNILKHSALMSWFSIYLSQFWKYIVSKAEYMYISFLNVLQYDQWKSKFEKFHWDSHVSMILLDVHFLTVFFNNNIVTTIKMYFVHQKILPKDLFLWKRNLN